jgi:hypothetical protein
LKWNEELGNGAVVVSNVSILISVRDKDMNACKEAK